MNPNFASVLSAYLDPNFLSGIIWNVYIIFTFLIIIFFAFKSIDICKRLIKKS